MSVTEKRSLSLRQASNCEQAKEPVCRCRCGGTLHGARRGEGQAFFEGLPVDDPHSLPSAEAKEAKRKAKLEEKRQQKEAEWRARYEAARQKWSNY